MLGRPTGAVRVYKIADVEQTMHEARQLEGIEEELKAHHQQRLNRMYAP